MNIHIALIGYAIDLTPLVGAIAGPDTFFHIYLHSQRPEARTIFGWGHDAHLDIHDYGTNRGLSTSWNDALVQSQSEGADAILIINDDVTMTRDDMLKLAQGCIDHREAAIIEARGFNERMNEYQNLQAACFGINPIALDTVGYFDENFYPIYFEDTDHSRRLNLLGGTFYNVGDTGIVHKGSATVNGVPALSSQNQITFPACHHYYRLKHGGSPGSETFKYPFGDPQLSWKIDADSRHNPYPEHQRTDKDVAKI